MAVGMSETSKQSEGPAPQTCGEFPHLYAKPPRRKGGFGLGEGSRAYPSYKSLRISIQTHLQPY